MPHLAQAGWLTTGSNTPVVKSEIKYLLTALMFFTRVPVYSGAAQDKQSLNQALKYFPLIGWLVGGFCAVVFYLGLQIWPAAVAIIISMLAGILITGAMHEDGLADCCDAFGGGWDQQQVLAIMKDPRIGAYGAIGLILVLLCKAIVLIELASVSVGLTIATLMITHSASRFLVLPIIFKLDYVQALSQSKSRPMVEKRLGLPMLLYGAGFVIIPLWIFDDMSITLAVLIGAISAAAMGYYFYRRIGGYSGDCLGAIQQISEIVIYLSILGLWTSV